MARRPLQQQVRYGVRVDAQSWRGWTEKVLHSFDNKGADGIDAQAGVVIDGSGSLYGTIQGGGAFAKGTVFELTPKAGGGWTEQVLHTFQRQGRTRSLWRPGHRRLRQSLRHND
jgi:uncharacterized repeat protein (TIGR03803 family)